MNKSIDEVVMLIWESGLDVVNVLIMWKELIVLSFLIKC